MGPPNVFYINDSSFLVHVSQLSLLLNQFFLLTFNVSPFHQSYYHTIWLLLFFFNFLLSVRHSYILSSIKLRFTSKNSIFEIKRSQQRRLYDLKPKLRMKEYLTFHCDPPWLILFFSLEPPLFHFMSISFIFCFSSFFWVVKLYIIFMCMRKKEKRSPTFTSIILFMSSSSSSSREYSCSYHMVKPKPRNCEIALHKQIATKSQINGFICGFFASHFLFPRWMNNQS